MKITIKKRGFKTNITVKDNIIKCVDAFRQALELEGYSREGIDKYIPIVGEVTEEGTN